MGIINRPNDYTANTTISSSEVNDDFDTIYNEFNGSVAAANLATDAVTTAKIAADAVTNAKLADASVLPEQLIAGTGTGWAWQSWTPTWANLTATSATVDAKYIQIGKTVFYRLSLIFGASSAMGTAPTFTLPVTSVSYTAEQPIGTVRLSDATGSKNMSHVAWRTTTTAGLTYTDASGTYVAIGNPTATVPFTWTTSDAVLASGTYEAA